MKKYLLLPALALPLLFAGCKKEGSCTGLSEDCDQSLVATWELSNMEEWDGDSWESFSECSIPSDLVTFSSDGTWTRSGTSCVFSASSGTWELDGNEVNITGVSGPDFENIYVEFVGENMYLNFEDCSSGKKSTGTTAFGDCPQYRLFYLKQ